MSWFRCNGISGVIPPVPPTPVDPPIPQTGTWQLKGTTGKKYLILGTDDDNTGDAKFFRLLRTYGFPYTMNVEAENASIYKDLGSDVDENIFTDADAPALFPNRVNVVELGQYLHDNHMGEVAQHGGSGKVLWDSALLTGSELTTLYNSYVSSGGEKTQEEFKQAIMEQKASTDCSQDASYVASSRTTLESLYGFPIETVGIWGGSPTATVDGITVDMNSLKRSSTYGWRAHNYAAVSNVLGNYAAASIYSITRSLEETVADAKSNIDAIGYGKIHELFWHAPFSDIGASNLRTLFTYIKGLVDAGKYEVVTRKQYYELGEYVANPVVSISASRPDITVGDTDSKSAYTVTATYYDGTTANVLDEAIVFNENVDTDTVGTYAVDVTYRGFSQTINVVVTDGGSASVDLHLVYKGSINDSTGAFVPNSYDTKFASQYTIPYDPTRTYYLSFTGTDSNSHSYPYISAIHCYASNGNYLGKVTSGLSGMKGRCSNVAMPDIETTFPDVASFRLAGSVNKSYGTNQTVNWNCHADVD